MKLLCGLRNRYLGIAFRTPGALPSAVGVPVVAILVLVRPALGLHISVCAPFDWVIHLFLFLSGAVGKAAG
jgi:hypothetical protein